MKGEDGDGAVSGRRGDDEIATKLIPTNWQTLRFASDLPEKL